MHPFTMEIVTRDKMRKFHGEADERRDAKSLRAEQRADAARRVERVSAALGATAVALTVLLLLI